MSEKLKETLTTIAIFTAIPADIIAIVPVVYKGLLLIQWTQRIYINPENQDMLLGSMFVRELSIILVFYSFIGIVLWLNRLLKNEKPSRLDSAIYFARMLCISTTLFFGVSEIIILTVFDVIPLSHGLAIASTLIIMSIYFSIGWKRGKDNSKYQLYFDDLGFKFLLWLPVIWFALEVSSSSNGFDNFGWSLYYAATGYTLSLLIAEIVARLLSKRVENLNSAALISGNLSINLIPFIIFASWVMLGVKIITSPIILILWILIPSLLLLFFIKVLVTEVINELKEKLKLATMDERERIKYQNDKALNEAFREIQKRK